MGEVDTGHVHSGHYRLFQDRLRIRRRPDGAHQLGFVRGKRHATASLTSERSMIHTDRIRGFNECESVVTPVLQFHLFSAH